jgi:IclR family transcriptional regulator, KDG regulon repressor
MDVNMLPAQAKAAELPEELRQRYTAPAVKLACAVLRQLARRRRPQSSLSELASEVGTNKTTAMRVLHELEREGFVYYDDATKKWGLGAYLFVLGNRAAEHAGVLPIALPALRPAARDTGYTCVLVQRDGPDHLTFIAREEPDSPVRVSVTVGQRFPLTAGSHGRVFLAHLPAEVARRVVGRVGLPEQAPAASTAQYLAGLEPVQSDGYAVSIGEHVPGIFGIAAPIYDMAGEVVLTLSAIGVAASLDDAETLRVGTVLKRRADAVSRALGWRREAST